jgi:hypothetical protein
MSTPGRVDEGVGAQSQIWKLGAVGALSISRTSSKMEVARRVTWFVT